MNRRRWMPPFFVGVAVAVVLEAGVGLLLFVSPGLMPALTVILGVAWGSFGLGLATRPGHPPAPGTVRWRWLLALGSLLIAAVLSLGWSFHGGVHETGLVRGLHLAALVALPLYGLGACMATVMDPSDGAGSGALASLGGMTGALAMGVLLVPRFEPTSAYLFCVLCLSAAALGRPAA